MEFAILIISVLRNVEWYFFERTFCDPDRTSRFAASDLVLHCLPMTHKKDSRRIWVKIDLPFDSLDQPTLGIRKSCF